jgi:hypothetical protein
VDKYGLTDEMLEAYLKTELEKRGVGHVEKCISNKNIYPIILVLLMPDLLISDDAVSIEFQVKDICLSKKNTEREFDAIIYRSGSTFYAFDGAKSILNKVDLILNRFIKNYNTSNRNK